MKDELISDYDLMVRLHFKNAGEKKAYYRLKAIMDRRRLRYYIKIGVAKEVAI